MPQQNRILKESEVLEQKINALLEPHGMVLASSISYPLGGLRKADCPRWESMVGIKNMRHPTQPIWSIASWDTVTACVRSKLVIDFQARLDYAPIMVNVTTHA